MALMDVPLELQKLVVEKAAEAGPIQAIVSVTSCNNDSCKLPQVETLAHLRRDVERPTETETA